MWNAECGKVRIGTFQVSSLRPSAGMMEQWNSGVMGSGMMQCWINGPATGGIDHVKNRTWFKTSKSSLYRDDQPLQPPLQRVYSLPGKLGSGSRHVAPGSGHDHKPIAGVGTCNAAWHWGTAFKSSALQDDRSI